MVQRKYKYMTNEKHRPFSNTKYWNALHTMALVQFFFHKIKNAQISIKMSIYKSDDSDNFKKSFKVSLNVNVRCTYNIPERCTPGQ